MVCFIYYVFLYNYFDISQVFVTNPHKLSLDNVENEGTEILCVHITITISIYIAPSLHVILVLLLHLLHHLGVNHTTVNILAFSVCVKFGVQRMNPYIFYKC